jgi:hypothetical protein
MYELEGIWKETIAVSTKKNIPSLSGRTEENRANLESEKPVFRNLHRPTKFVTELNE